MAKQLAFGDDARQKIIKGVKRLADAVSATMGPAGRNVLIEKKYGGPTVTKDGVSVAKEIELEDTFENMGAQLVKEAATKTNDAAGDGTTTATVLAYAMMEAGLRHLGTGSNAIGVKRGILKAVDLVSKNLETQAKPITKKEEFAAVATISAQDPEVGEVIADIFDKVGKEGVVTVDKGETLGIEQEYVEGMQFDQGYISAYFATDTARMEAVFQKAHILITDKKISSIQEILPLLEALAQRGKKELVIIAETVEGEALATLVVNKLRGTFSTLAVKAPAFGDRRKEILKDIAALTGGRVISEEIGLKLENATIDDLGTARRVISTKDATTIIDGGGKKEDIEARIGQIKGAIEGTKSDFDREKLQERLGKLTGGVAVIKVGAATRAAAEEGIVPGGGTAYLRALEAVDLKKAATEDEEIGMQIVRDALSAPLERIADNAGAVGKVVVERVRKEHKGTEGFNAMTGEYEDLVKARVIDPKKVTRSALENAASVAAMFLTLEVAICDLPKKDDAPMMPPGGGMGGMGDF